MRLDNLLHVRRSLDTAPCRVVLAACCCMALAKSPLLADGVTRSVEPVAGGCRVTLAWDFSGKVESDLIIEERFGEGWAVDGSTVPFGSLDATWLSGPVAKFAVKPSLLASAGSISFTVVPGGDGLACPTSGKWMMYLSGTLRKGAVAGDSALASLVGTTGTPQVGGTSDVQEKAETPVAISSFKVLGRGAIELSYSGVAKSGTIVVEGCRGLGRGWSEIKRATAASGDGKVVISPDDLGGCSFFRMKLLTEE